MRSIFYELAAFAFVFGIAITAAWFVGGAIERAEHRRELARTERCLSMKPICMPGQHPICMCSSDYSFDCAWICASAR